MELTEVKEYRELRKYQDGKEEILALFKTGNKVILDYENFEQYVLTNQSTGETEVQWKRS